MNARVKAYKLWDWLNGRKTLLGVFIATIYGGLLYTGTIQESKEIEFLITTVLGVGIGHKVVKGE